MAHAGCSLSLSLKLLFTFSLSPSLKLLFTFSLSLTHKLLFAFSLHAQLIFARASRAPHRFLRHSVGSLRGALGELARL